MCTLSVNRCLPNDNLSHIVWKWLKSSFWVATSIASNCLAWLHLHFRRVRHFQWSPAEWWSSSRWRCPEPESQCSHRRRTTRGRPKRKLRNNSENYDDDNGKMLMLMLMMCWCVDAQKKVPMKGGQSTSFTIINISKISKKWHRNGWPKTTTWCTFAFTKSKAQGEWESKGNHRHAINRTVNLKVLITFCWLNQKQ